MTLDHPDYQAMLAAVLADPADDVPRLILADWLQEQPQWRECGRCKGRSDWYDALTGDGRCPDCSGSGRVPNGYAEYGEFIRVQVELATKSDCPDWCDHDPAKCRVEALRERERDLLDQHWSAWIRGAGLVPDGWKLSTDGDSFHVWRDDPFNDGYRFQFRRGFPDSVSLPLRTWVGEPCDGCDGSGGWNLHGGRRWHCTTCRGLGTVGGIGPELVRRCPLSRVTTDREPAHEIHVNYEIGIPAVGWGWCRVPGAQPDRRHHLPPELFDRMELPICPSYPEIKQARTRQAALDALSAACLGWARGGTLAGSPERGR